MSWRATISSFLKAGTAVSMTGGLVLAGTYLAYTDFRRYRRMISAYSGGKLLSPLDTTNAHETVYFRRDQLESSLRRVLSPTFSNQYYVIRGDSGTGKSRTIVELTREMINEQGKKRLGAPIYVHASQGKGFVYTLATAVKYDFDEDNQFWYLFDLVTKIYVFPKTDDKTRLVRVLEAIEKSAFVYNSRIGKPVVIVIDGVNTLARSQPEVLETLQEKARLWADTNTVKMVFIVDDGTTDGFLNRQPDSLSSLSGVRTIDVGDLTRQEAIIFLQSPLTLELDSKNIMSSELASRVVDLVGGRLDHLIAFKHDFDLGVPFEETAARLKQSKWVKYLHLSHNPSVFKVVTALRSSPDETMQLSKLVKQTSVSDVEALAKADLLRFERNSKGTLVRFQSKLSANTLAEEQHD